MGRGVGKWVHSRGGYLPLGSVLVSARHRSLSGATDRGGRSGYGVVCLRGVRVSNRRTAEEEGGTMVKDDCEGAAVIRSVCHQQRPMRWCSKVLDVYL